RCDIAPLFGCLGLLEDCSVVSRLFNVENELAGLVGAAFHLFDKDAIGRFRKQLQIRQARIGKPFANLVKALRDHRQRRSSGEQPSNLARRRKIAETIKAVAGFNQTEHGELGDNLLRQLAQRSKLVRGVGLGLLFGGTLSEPLKELSLAGDQNAVGFRPGETVRWPAVIEKGPTESADDEHIGAFRHALARFAAVRPHERESVGPPHRRKPAGEGDSAFERHAVGFGVLRQRPVFLLAPAPAPARVLVLVAAGFFSFSAPMLARSASMRLITRRGAGPSSRTGSIARPSRFFLNSSTSAVS